MRNTGSALHKVSLAAIFASILGVVAASTPAFAVTITVGSGTGGGAENASVPDPNLRVVAGAADTDFSDPAFATAVATLNGGGGTIPFITRNAAWSAPVGGTLYVSPEAGGASAGSTGAYLATFTLPAFSAVSLDVDFLVDNSLNGFLLNGNPISTPAGGFGSVNDVADVTNPSFFTVGTNRLIFRAVDSGGPGGFDFLATINFTPGVNGGAVPEPATLALLGLGLVGLGFARRKRS